MDTMAVHDRTHAVAEREFDAIDGDACVSFCLGEDPLHRFKGKIIAGEFVGIFARTPVQSIKVIHSRTMGLCRNGKGVKRGGRRGGGKGFGRMKGM